MVSIEAGVTYKKILQPIFQAVYVNIIDDFKFSFTHLFGNLPLSILILIGLIMTPFTILARLYILIESFISIRSVPAGVYAEIVWAQFIPHL